jgi:nucleotide-binding universal stress UspA family protein
MSTHSPCRMLRPVLTVASKPRKSISSVKVEKLFTLTAADDTTNGPLPGWDGITLLKAIKVKRILFATDFLENSRLALDYATAIAQYFKATLIMLNVIELSQAGMEAELETKSPCMTRLDALKRLDVLAAGAGANEVRTETHVQNGVPSERILEAVASYHADMLVLGVHGIHRGLSHLLIGSNTERILMSAACPTLTVGAHALAGVDLGFHPKEILYYSDLSPAAASAAPYALWLGKVFHAPVEVCQLTPKRAGNNPELLKRMVERYCETVAQLIPKDQSKWCESSFHLQKGVAVDQVLHRATTNLAGMIVSGIKRRSTFGRHVHTSFAYRLLANASCPVLTIGDQSS